MTTIQHDGKSNQHRPKQPPEVSRQVPGWGHVDESSWESFPASDAPAHGAGAEGAPPTLNGEPYVEQPDARPGAAPGSSRREQLRAKTDELKHQAARGWESLRTHLRALGHSVRERLQRH